MSSWNSRTVSKLHALCLKKPIYLVFINPDTTFIGRCLREGFRKRIVSAARDKLGIARLALVFFVPGGGCSSSNYDISCLEGHIG